MTAAVPNHTLRQPSQLGWKFWIPVVAVCGVLTCLGIRSLRQLEPIIVPQPEMLHVSVTDVQRSKLPSKVLSFLERIEARDVSGRMEKEFAEVFSEADKVEESQNWRRYFFSLDGTTRDLEGHPVIAVQVQKKTTRIIYCAVTVPTW